MTKSPNSRRGQPTAKHRLSYTHTYIYIYYTNIYIRKHYIQIQFDTQQQHEVRDEH